MHDINFPSHRQFAPTSAFTMKMREQARAQVAATSALAYSIADESAAADLESHCTPVKINGVTWYQSEEIDGNSYEFADPDQVRWVKDALQYLALRGYLIRHSENSSLVRVDQELLNRALAQD